MSVVTISGPLGSGGPEVGREIADRIQADYVDRQIIGEVAARVDREEQEVIAKEMPPSSFLGRVAEALGHGLAFGDGIAGAYLPLGQIPLDDTRYLHALESVVRELARSRSQSLVILGRGSQFILKDYPQVFRLLTVAPIEVRVDRVMQTLKADRETAELEISHFDNSLRMFTKKYFKAELEDPVYYDLVLNTERFGFRAAASIIVDALSLKGKTTP